LALPRSALEEIMVRILRRGCAKMCLIKVSSIQGSDNLFQGNKDELVTFVELFILF